MMTLSLKAQMEVVVVMGEEGGLSTEHQVCSSAHRKSKTVRVRQRAATSD